MSSRKQDMLGRLIDTALLQDDDAPGFDGRGYTALRTRRDADISDDTEDDTAFQALRESGSSPQEALANVNYMKPLTEEEADILDETPLLDRLYKVDDAEHQQWLLKVASKDSKGMDRVKEDAIYGERTMNNNEERMEREDVDSDSGWGFHVPGLSSLKKGLSKGLHAAESVAKAPLGLLAHFVPGRDARKAALVRNTYKKLWYEHANWLAHQDKNAGRILQPRASYEQAAKVWAIAQLKQNKLPTNMIPLAERPAPTSMSGSDKTTALRRMIIGSDVVVGSWYWPFGQFLSFARTTVNNTTTQRADAPPDGQDAQAPGYQDVSSVAAPQQDQGPPPGYDDSQQGEYRMLGWNGFIKTKGLDGILGGIDCLGAYATQILGQDLPAKDNPHADAIVKTLVFKLKNGKPIDAGEIGLLNSAAKEGNVKAQKVLAYLNKEGAVAKDTSGLDPWLYKLSPGYWLRSKTSKEMKDVEEKKWVENAELQKQLKKQQEDLNAAEKAAQATAAVEAAKAQSASTEAQLKEIQASLKGSMSGSFVGHEKITPISQVVVDALTKTGQKETAGHLYAKIASGQPLSADELKSARRISKLIGRMRVVHGDLIDDQNEALTMHGAFIGACVIGDIDQAIEQNARYQHLLAGMDSKVKAGKPLTQDERNALATTLKGAKELHKTVTSLVSGRAFVGCPEKTSWTRGAFVGAAKVMSEEDKKMLASIVSLAKVGNPRAQKALAALKQSGEIAGGSFIGFGFTDAFKYATAPVWAPAYGLYKGAQWTGKKMGIGTGQSAESRRLSMMKAAAKRRQAAEARAAAADAETAAEQRAQNAIADAADAEADAADAKALAKEEAMKTKEVEADPSSLVRDDQSGWKNFVEAGDAPIVAKASEKSPTGDKLRASKTLLKQALKRQAPGGEQAYQAIATINKKARAGDLQAKRDRMALLAARKALLAEQKAKKKQELAVLKAQRKKEAQARAEARRTAILAYQKKLEAAAGDRLARMSRKHELSKHFKAEAMAAKGNPKAKAYVAKQTVLAKQGDKKAQAHVEAMLLGRQTRLMTQTKSEKKAMARAMKFVARLRKNDPGALRDFKILKDARAKGNPVATRTLDQIQMAMMLDNTVRTGVVATRKSKITIGPVTLMAKSAWQQKQASMTAKQKAKAAVASANKKAASGTGSREELAHGADQAHKLGDHETAAVLADAASKAPSATATIQKQAAKVQASDSGHPEAQADLKKSIEGAKSGNPEDIQALGATMAARTCDDINKGKPMSQTMKDAHNLNEQIKANDPVAIKKAEQITAAATQPNPPPEATLAAGAMVGTKLIDQSLATRPMAKQELMDRVNEPVPAAEKSAAHAKVTDAVVAANNGTITAEEAHKASDLALRLGQPKQAAEIIALAPPWDSDPMSSLPDQPLPPIQGFWDLIKASLQALTFTTPDPFANYRGGVANRGTTRVANPPTASLGWSPFGAFQKSLPALAMASMPTMAVAQVASLLKKPGTQHVVVETKAAPTPAAAPAPAAAPTPAAAPAPATAPVAPAAAAAVAASSGHEILGSDEYKGLIAKALKDKKMSKDDFNKAVKSNLPASADDDTKKASAKQTLEFLQSKKVTVGGAFVGADKTFKEYVVEAVKTKKMSRDDFNKAIDVHCGASADKEAKKAAGEKVLAFLKNKGVAVG